MYSLFINAEGSLVSGVCVFVCLCVCVCVCVCVHAKFHVERHGIKEESLFKWSRSFVVFIIVDLRGPGAFSRDFTINLSPPCRAFNRALKTEKLKAPLFPGLQMTGA